MAGKFGSASAFLLVGGYNLIGTKVKGLSYKIAAEHEDTLGLGDSFKNSVPTGVSVLTIKQDQGFFDTSANGGHAALKDVATSPQATQRIITFGYAGQTLGESYVGAEGVYSQEYEVLSEGSKLTKANVAYAVSGRVDNGVLLHILEAETIDEDGASVDNAASSANGGAGVLQVTAFSGLTSAVIKVQHSTDNFSGSIVDLITFATVTSAPTAERIAVAGTVNRYTRYTLDVTGTGSITFLVGFARNPAA